MADKRKNLFLGAIFFSICFTIFIIRVLRIESKYNDIHKKFSPIIQADTLNNFVTKIHVFSGFKYSPTMVFVSLDNNKKYEIESRLNPNYLNMGINEILEIGDKLQKELGNDTIYVIKTDTSKKNLYHFLLDSSTPPN